LDSYKNKNWQAYTAAVAAAYTKELLGLIELTVIRSIPPIELYKSNIRETIARYLA
jgi:hypothetical protein